LGKVRSGGPVGIEHDSALPLQIKPP